MIVTSHLLGDVEDVCDRVIILYGGKIRATGSLNELLTVKGSSRITTPDLPEEAMSQITEILKKNLDGRPFTIDHPRMSLEDFFLDVVNKAKRESVETSGATSGGEIAEYLSDSAPQVTADEKLNVLAGIKPEEPPVQKVEKEPEQEINTARLTSLEEEDKPVEKTPIPEDAEAKLKLEEANKKLMDILSSGKEK